MKLHNLHRCPALFGSSKRVLSVAKRRIDTVLPMRVDKATEFDTKQQRERDSAIKCKAYERAVTTQSCEHTNALQLRIWLYILTIAI